MSGAVRACGRWALAVLTGWLLLAAGAQAHWVAAQRGTLNLVQGGAYLVLSLPVSAFSGIDDDHDGLLSPGELRAHVSEIETQVQHGVALSDPAGTLPLQGVLLNTMPPDGTPPGTPASHLAVLGRFALAADGAGGWQTSDLQLRLRLFGTGPDEQAEQVTVTRGLETQLLTLTPERNQRALLPSAWAVFADHVQLGAEHVLSGPDHLLFLLVVLATGWSLRQMALALTCFTFGHALTLVACALFGLAAPSALVEPAIAATIVGMALFDRWAQRRPRAFSEGVRLSLVGACALIHGLGLAGALTDLGLDSAHKLWSLAGFNVGIELGQLLVALLATAAMALVHSLHGPAQVQWVTRLASYVAMATGSFWFVQRVVFPA